MEMLTNLPGHNEDTGKLMPNATLLVVKGKRKHSDELDEGMESLIKFLDADWIKIELNENKVIRLF